MKHYNALCLLCSLLYEFRHKYIDTLRTDDEVYSMQQMYDNTAHIVALVSLLRVITHKRDAKIDYTDAFVRTYEMLFTVASQVESEHAQQLLFKICSRVEHVLD